MEVSQIDLFEKSTQLVTKSSPLQGLVIFLGDESLYTTEIEDYY